MPAVLATVVSSLALGVVDEPVDLRISLAVGDPVLVTIDRTLSCALTVAGKPATSWDVTESQQFIDEFTTIDAATARYESKRLYVRSQSARNGQNQDPPLAGVTVNMRRVGDEGGLDVGDDFALPRKLLNVQLQRVPNAGAWLGMPESATHGAAVDAQIEAWISTLLDTENLVLLERSTLVLDSVGEDRVAVVKGEVVVSEPVDLRGAAPATARYEGELELRVHLDEHRIVSSSYGGKSTISAGGESGVPGISGSGTFAAKLSVARGDAVSAARSAIVAPRPRVRELPQGVSLQTPGLWAESEISEKIAVFARTRDAKKGTAFLNVERRSLGTDKIAELQKALEADYKTKGMKVKLSPTSSSLGKGLLLETTDEKGAFIHNEMYPVGANEWVWVKLSGPKAAVDIAMPEFQKTRATLKELSK